MKETIPFSDHTLGMTFIFKFEKAMKTMIIWPASQKQNAIGSHGNTKTHRRIMIIDEGVFGLKKVFVKVATIFASNHIAFVL